MFRLTTRGPDGPHQPAYYLLCENRLCSSSCTMPADISSPAAQNESLTIFFNKAQLEGWQIGWDGQVCPACLKREREAQEKAAKLAAQAKPLIQIASLHQQKLAEREVGGIGEITGPGINGRT